jgi:SAM-dependent methyltransferase
VDIRGYEQFERLENEHWWLRGRRSLFFHLLDGLLPRNGPVNSLDVGCGYGGMVRELQRYGPASGVDIFPGAVEYCRRRGLENVQEASAYALPAPDGNFDVVTFFDCLEHLDDDVAALRESHRVLRPGGFVVISSPAYNFLWTNNDEMAHHKRRYTLGELRSKLEVTGFELRKATYFNVMLFPLIVPVLLLRRLKERLFPKPDDATTNLTHSLPRPINELLFRVFSSERFVLRRVSMPVGHSVFAVAVKS